MYFSGRAKQLALVGPAAALQLDRAFAVVSVISETGCRLALHVRMRTRKCRRATVSNRGHAAIDGEIHACDEACFVRSEEQGGRRDLLWATEPPERDGRGELGAGLVGPLFGRRLLLEDWRVDWARADRIDPDATILQLRRPRADEGADCRLGGAVSGEAGDALVRGDLGDHDDRPAVIQKRQRFLHREDQAPRVDRKEPVVAFPQAWLADVLARIADHKINDLAALLPWNWRGARIHRAA